MPRMNKLDCKKQRTGRFSRRTIDKALALYARAFGPCDQKLYLTPATPVSETTPGAEIGATGSMRMRMIVHPPEPLRSDRLTDQQALIDLGRSFHMIWADRTHAPAMTGRPFHYSVRLTHAAERALEYFHRSIGLSWKDGEFRGLLPGLLPQYCNMTVEVHFDQRALVLFEEEEVPTELKYGRYGFPYMDQTTPAPGDLRPDDAPDHVHPFG